MAELESFGIAGPIERSGVKLVRMECKTALSPSNLPGLDFALNPYFGCSHSCLYCYAPFVLHQPRNDWGKTVKAKVNVAKILACEVRKKAGVIGIGTVTDPYQEGEERLQLTRKCLMELLKADLPISILTKSPLVVRDVDLLSKLRKAEVGVTITTQFDDLASRFEPGAPPPSERLRAVKQLIVAGIDTYVLIGPILPGITDKDLEDFFHKIALTGVKRVMVDKLRLRPGMLTKLLSVVKDEKVREEFTRKAQSDRYFDEVAERMRKLAGDYGIAYCDAF